MTRTKIKTIQAIESNGWFSLGGTLVYATTTTATISGDWTGLLQKGMRIKLTNSTVKYFIIADDPSYSDPNTTLTLHPTDSTTALVDSAITLPSYSFQEQPFGFPDLPYVQAMPNSAQTGLLAAVATLIVLDNEVVDIGSNFASSIFITPCNGLYQIEAGVHFKYIEADQAIFYVHKNDVTIFSTYNELGVSAKDHTVVGSRTIRLAKGDTIKLIGYRGTEGDLVLSNNRTSLTITYIRT